MDYYLDEEQQVLAALVLLFQMDYYRGEVRQVLVASPKVKLKLVAAALVSRLAELVLVVFEELRSQ
jgi:hypothetical protein